MVRILETHITLIDVQLTFPSKAFLLFHAFTSCPTLTLQIVTACYMLR